MFEKTFFFYFLFLVSDSLSSFNHLELVFPFFFLWQSLLRLQLHIQGNFRWSQGGKCPLCPPLAPPLLTTIGKTKKKKKKQKPIKDQTTAENQRERCGSIWVSRFSNLTICGSSWWKWWLDGVCGEEMVAEREKVTERNLRKSRECEIWEEREKGNKK